MFGRRKMKDKEMKEQTLKTAMEGMRAFIRNRINTGNQATTEDCFTKAMDNILAFRNNPMPHNWIRNTPTTENRRALINELGPLAEEIRKQCSEIVMREGILSKTNTIQALSVEAAINTCLQEAGIKSYSLFRQKYRYKLFIDLGKESCLTIPVRFNAVEKQLPKVVETVQNAQAMIDTFGKDLKIG